MDRRKAHPQGFLDRFREQEIKETVETSALTQCPYCSMQCTMWLREERTPHNRRLEVSPNREDPVVQGRVCLKGMNAHDSALDHPDRLRTPLLRKEGELTPVSWEEAMHVFQKRVQSVQARWGRDAVGVFGGGSLTNEEAYLLGKFARVALGTRHIDYNGRYCMSSAATAANQAFGVDRGLTNPLSDLAITDCILLAGANIAECQPTMMPVLRQAKKGGASLIVIDPRETPTARLADLHLKVQPGTDATLVNGLLRVIVEEGLVDEAFVRAHTTGWEELRAHINRVSLEEVARRTGVSAADIRRAARVYGRASKGFVLTARGVEQQAHGVMNVRNFINLVLVTGKIGLPGSGYGAVTGQGNGQGGREHGQKADQLPGYRRIDDSAHRRAIARVWGVDESELPGSGVSAYEMVEAMDRQEIRSMIILSSNPVVSTPNANLAQRALDKLDFLVCIDLFLSETAELADLVLPGSAYLEDEGTMTNLEGRVILRKAVRPLPGKAKLDWQILMEMARVLGKGEYFRYDSAEAIFEELRRASKGGLADYSGISYERIEKEKGVFWPCPEEKEKGQARLFTDGRFFHPDGRARLIPVSDVEPPELIDPTYPLLLTTGRVLSHYLTGVQTRRSPSLIQKEPEPLLTIHPETADALGLKDGEKARVSSRRGSLTLKIKRSDHIRKDVVFCPMHWGGEGAVNRLTLPQLDPQSRMPSFKACAVRVEALVPQPQAGKQKGVREMSKRKLVVVGNGMAGVNVVEHVLKLDRDAFDITIFGKEPHPNYNRILLSSVLAGDTGLEDIVLNSWDWYRENGIRLHAGRAVTRIDTEKRQVHAERGISAPYDALLLATGSHPFMLPLPGANKEGVIAFRDIQDCEAMMEAAQTYKKAAVIGGGLLGLEAARGLLNLGMDVDVIHLFDTLMERQLDREAARMLQRELENQGMRFLLEKQTERILGQQRVTGLRFKDGSSVEADLVVMAVGIRPQVELAQKSGIQVNRGVVVDDWMQTSIPHIYAVGECAEHRGTVYGLVAPHREQAAVLAKRLCGLETEPYEGSVTATKLKVSGVDVFSAGEFNDTADTRSLRHQDEWKGTYKKVLLRNNRIVGGVLFGDTSDSAFLLRCIREEREMTDTVHATLMGAATENGNSPAQTLAEDDQVCDCNGVSKGEILCAVREHGLNDLEGVQRHTKAGASCGGCKPLVTAILEEELGEAFDPAAATKAPICTCTDLTRDEVVDAIREKGLTMVRETMHVLGWKTPEGCPKCRPAINYYLNMVWPGQAEDDRMSRIVNEQRHANIQNDGTYSVVPRMYGGVTSPAELRRIADAAEKYNVRMVKVTGGQRIDLLGVKKEDLPKIWEEIGMPSGHAYAKGVRTVKTCVGEDFCRFGTQDSIGLGIRMEKRFEGLDTPHKVKMAVSACPRNCAESGIKDVGVVGVEGGWEIYVGGNGGVNLRGGDFLCKVRTEEEVLEITGAILQFYRETGEYGERTSAWVERIGLEAVKQAVVEDREYRKQLLERIEQAQKSYQDPWKKDAKDARIRKTLYEEAKV